MFEKNLKYYRLKKNMSMKDLAEACGVTSMAISNYESGKRKAAEKEGVEVFGTIGLLDRLYDGDYINKIEYQFCLKSLLEHKERRLPEEELQKRINSLR